MISVHVLYNKWWFYIISDKCTCFIYRINEHMVRLFYNYNNDKIIYSTIYICIYIYIYIHTHTVRAKSIRTRKFFIKKILFVKNKH